MTTTPLSPSPEYATALVRAYTRPAAKKAKAGKRRWIDPHPSHIVVFDTETTDDTEQKLLFGVYRIAHCDWSGDEPRLTFLDEGLIYADGLQAERPRAYQALRRYANTHLPDVAPGPDSALTMGFHSRSEFVEDVLYRRCFQGRAMLVGFNLPFDITRLALGWGRCRKGGYAGGFSLKFFEFELSDGTRRERADRPRIRLKSIGQRRSLIGFAAPMKTDRADRVPEGSTSGRPRRGYSFPGHFLDLMTLCFALTGKPHSLESACSTKGFNVEVAGNPYRKRKVIHGRVTAKNITYCREDVEATAGLFVKAIAEHERHPIDQPAEKIYSPASYTKGYLRQLGIKPPLQRNQDFPVEVLGYAMAGYYGGRVECHIPQAPVPVIHTDFLSMYPTVSSLLHVWDMLICSKLTARELNPDEIEQLQNKLNQLSAAELLKPETWVSLRGVALVDPNGARLPLRTKWGGQSSSIGSVPLTSDSPLSYALPDLAAATMLGDRLPRILRAWVFEPTGRPRGLRPVNLRGSVLINPRTDRDLFRAVIEERAKLPNKKSDLGMFLKTLANATYGVFAEIIRRDETEALLEVHGLESFALRDVSHPEDPGEYCFPPIACLITAGARLMLALLERLIADKGGTYAFCDTDSMAIVATELGGLIPCPGGQHETADGQPAIRALSRAEVLEIVEQFQALKPYDPAVVPGSILKVEDVNYIEGGEDTPEGSGQPRWRQLFAYSISPKRYALYEHDPGRGLKILDYKEHGLGYLLGPSDPDDDKRNWIQELWEYIVATDALGLDAPEPSWLTARDGSEQIAMGQLTLSTPDLMQGGSNPATYSGLISVLPHTFVLTPHVAPNGHPIGADPTTFQLLGGYTKEPSAWRDLRCVEKHTGQEYRITAGPPPADWRPTQDVVVKTYRHVLNDYRRNANPTGVGPDGAPATKHTRGCLRPRPMHVFKIEHVGAETKLADEMTARTIHDENEALRHWKPTTTALNPHVREILLTMPVRQAVALTGLSEKTIKRVRRGSPVADRTRAQLELALALWALEQLLNAGHTAPAIDRFGRWLHRRQIRERMESDPLVTQIGPVELSPRDEIGALLAAARTTITEGYRTCRCGCGDPVKGRYLYSTRACQVRAYRKRKHQPMVTGRP